MLERLAELSKRYDDICEQLAQPEVLADHARMRELLQKAPEPKFIVELGCGEGELCAMLGKWFPRARVVGTDYSQAILDDAKSRFPAIEFLKHSIYDPWERTDQEMLQADLVIVSEVLEHLETPEAALHQLQSFSRSHIFVSVPREPLWRFLNCLRGSYLRSWGNTPGHLQHWSVSAWLNLLQAYLEIVDVRYPLPWQMALCKPGKQISV